MKQMGKILVLNLILIVMFNMFNFGSNLMWNSKVSYAQSNDITIDGSDSDWINVENLYVGSGSVYNLSAKQENEMLYILIRGELLNQASDFYLDADNDPNTGFHSWAWANSGVEYLIQDTSLYRYAGTGKDWNWNYVDEIIIQKNDSVIELGVEFIKIDKTNISNMKLAYIKNNDEYIPSVGSNMIDIVEQSFVEPITYVTETSKSEGIINSNGSLELNTEYKPHNKFVVYYGELEYSGITDYSNFDFMIVHDRNIDSVSTVRNQGCEVIQYLYFGSRFDDSDIFISDLKTQILEFKNTGLADGVFLDECDVNYWGDGYSNDFGKCQIFYNRLKEISEYCKSIDMKLVINGSRAFAELGDYYLWESFIGYWDTNKLTWSNQIAEKVVLENGSLEYKRQFSDWTLNGSCYYDGQYIRDGSNGSIEITINMDDILDVQDRQNLYDWVYFEWFGEGADDTTCEIWAWTGDELPFDEVKWKKLPKLWKGEPVSWNGIGKRSKYLKLKMNFNGADNLRIDSLLMTFNYVYPYWDMNSSNGAADYNPFMWNYNNFKKEFLWEKMNESGNELKILTHSYGQENDMDKNMYLYLASKIANFASFNYVHPMMQDVYNTEFTDNPVGMFIKRENDSKAYFTGATATLNTSDNTYVLEREEPSYWYNRAVTIDGNIDEWSQSDEVYSNTGESYNASTQWWGVWPDNYQSGVFDNIRVVNNDGYDVLELEKDGVGSWISPIISSSFSEPESIMKEIDWDGGGEGSIDYFIKYKYLDDLWSDWISVPQSTSNPNQKFKAFQVKLVLDGKVSYTETINWGDDENGNPILEDVFHQGISFWGSNHQWDIVLNDDINIKRFLVTDDNKYIYFAFEVEGLINFDENPENPSDNKYNIFIDTLDNPDEGYIGDWWKTTFGSTYMISNKGLLKWDNTYQDRTDYNGWNWLGTSGVQCKKNETGNTIEYRISKSKFGNLDIKDLKVYMQVEETSTWFGNFINPIPDGDTSFVAYIPYSQKMYKNKAPHGWYCSDEFALDSDTGSIKLSWQESKPTSTNIKAWIRYRRKHSKWNDWQEILNGENITIVNGYKAQYCFGLYTSDGSVSPVVSNIQIEQFLRNILKYEYNDNGELMTIKEGDIPIIKFEYDENGNQIMEENALE